MIDLVIVGTIGLDTIETPFGKVKNALGGSAVYAALAARHFAKPGIVSIVGKDFPNEYKALLKENNIDLSGVQIKGKNFRWAGKYEWTMEEAKTLKTKLGNLAKFEPKIPPKFSLTPLVFLANLDPAIQLQAIEEMTKTGGRPFFVMDTMNYWIEKAREKLIEVIGKVQMLVLNEGEARMLFDTPNLIKAGRQALDLGPAYVAVKKGEHGALLFSQNNFFSAPGYPLEDVKDPTGAGDSFAGGMIGYLAKATKGGLANKEGIIDNLTMRRAVIYGSAIASVTTEDMGTQALQKIKLKDIEERYEVFQKIRQF